MNKSITVTVLLLASLTACSGLSPRSDGPAASISTNVGSSARVAQAVGPEPTEQPDPEPAIYPGNDRVVAMPQARPPVQLRGEAVSLNFEQAPVTEVVHSILGEILQLDYVIEHPLSGEITLRTRTPVARDQLLPILESLLQANGAVMVRDPDNRYFVSASGDLHSLMPGFTSPDAAGAGFNNVIVPLRYISASEMAEILSPVAPESAFVRVDNTRNLLVLAGSRNQIDGWMSIVSTFDIDQLQGMSVGIFPLKHGTVDDINAALAHLLGSEAGTDGVAAADLSHIVRVMPLERLNSILVVTPRAHYLEHIRTWINRLDQAQHSANEPTLYVFSVQNGSATHLAEILGSLFGGSSGTTGSRDGRSTRDTGVAPGLDSMTTGGRGGAGGGGNFTAPDTSSGDTSTSLTVGEDIRIIADEYNNAILIYALPRDFARIEDALKRLDVVANQVLIEASILEVSLTDDLEFGVEWHIHNSLGGGRTGSALLNTGGGNSIGPRVPGFSYSIANRSGELRGVINALAERSLVNVISTPSVMVLDNHTAAIHVGDQQPVQAATIASEGGHLTSSIDYRDTGVKLEVTPSVNSGGLVTMEILQSVTDVGPVDTATGQRTFLERNVSSKVAVRSGESVVLGGLIRDNQTTGKMGIPILHTLPVVGHLFGQTTNNSNRTELLVFITPRVLRGEQDLRDITLEMRSRMKGLKHFDDLPSSSPLPAALPVPEAAEPTP